jgi:hypothetical protein
MKKTSSAPARGSAVHQKWDREISPQRMRAVADPVARLRREINDDAVDTLVYLILGVAGDGIEEQKVHYV